jgi:hypothetical protein
MYELHLQMRRRRGVQVYTTELHLKQILVFKLRMIRDVFEITDCK